MSTRKNIKKQVEEQIENIKEEVIEEIEETNKKNSLPLSIIISKNPYIETTIRVAVVRDPVTKTPKIVPYRKHIIETSISELESLINKLNEIIESEEDEEKRSVLISKRIPYEVQLNNLKDLLTYEFVEWTAKWKRPNFKDLAEIEELSFKENAFGEKTDFSKYENSRLKLNRLLVEWDVEDENGPIPVKQWDTVDPDIISNFVEEFNFRLTSYIGPEIKK